MSTIWVVKFRQPPYVGVAAHWAIFLPDPHCLKDHRGVPTSGTLFHASKHKEKCLKLDAKEMTGFQFQFEYNLSRSATLMAWLPLVDTNVTTEIVSLACVAVTGNYEFCLVTRNCQEWVKEVIRGLAANGCIPKSVLVEMDLKGFQTLGEFCVKCAKSSSFRSCKCAKTNT